MTLLAFLVQLANGAGRPTHRTTDHIPAIRYSRQPDGTYLEETL